jgi:glycerol-3-phosphate acyltransferase PlsX
MAQDKRIKVVIDTMGSDNGPAVIVKGACQALSDSPDLDVILVGDKSVIEQALKENGAPMDRVRVEGTTEVITNYDHPVAAIQKKRDSSLVKALTILREEADCVGLVNAGSTGALLVGSMMFLSDPGERVRPALAAVLPAESGGFVCLVDTGANIDCMPSMLVQFAHQGSQFMKDLYRIESPKVGLLSNGAEETKGNNLVKETHTLLKADGTLNFVGNIEGTNALSGDCDVLVCDGFAGNQVLKTSEGIAKRIIKDIVRYSKKTGEPKLMELVQYLVAMYDFNSLGGGIVLGVKKPVIKAHGAANEASIRNTTKMLVNLARNKGIYV